MDIEVLINTTESSQLITLLKERKNVAVPSIDKVLSEFIPEMHKINDVILRPDKKVGGKTEPVSRIALGLQELAVKRMTEFMFAIPVNRIYHGSDKSDKHREAANAIENIFTSNHIDSLNILRGHSIFSACENATLWYILEKTPHKKYGFETNKVIRCKTYNPMESFKLYPYFDEYDDMLAMSVETIIRTGENTTETYFETYTDKRHLRWRTDKETQLIIDEPNVLGKIPYIYGYRKSPIWENCTSLINEIELSLSRNSDVIAYNSAPILTVSGTLVGSESKGESRRMYQLEQGGSISYVSWSQANDSVKYHVDTMLKLMWLQLQLPDISLENLRGMVSSGESMKTLLADAHLKVGDEKHVFIEYFERETSIVKAMLKQINPSLSSALEEIDVEHVITPFIQKDEDAEINKINKLTGNKPLMSQREGIETLGWSRDVEATIQNIEKETLRDNAIGRVSENDNQ